MCAKFVDTPFQPLVQQGPPDQTASANLVPFIAPDTNVNSYDSTVQQNSQQPLQPLMPQQQATTIQSAIAPATQQSAQANQGNIDQTQDQALIAQIRKHASAGQGFIPHALATLAALSGNFGPAMMLEEQKRKTALAIDAAPLIVKANQYKNRGEFDKAISLLQEGAGTFGPRSPEIAAHLSKEIENIDKKSQEWGSAETTYKGLVADAKGIKEQTGKDVAYAHILPVMGDIIAKKQPGGEKAFYNLLEMAKGNQVQQYEGGSRSINTATGIVTGETPYQQFMRPENLAGIPGQTLSAQHEMDITSLVDAMNGKPFVQKGIQYPGSPIVANALKQQLAQLQGPQAEREKAKLAPMSPQMNEQLSRVAALGGMSPQERNDRASRNDWPPEVQTAAYHAEIAKTTELATAGFEAQLNAPVVASNTGQMIVDKETGQLRPQMSIREAGKQQDKVSILDATKQLPQAQQLYAIRDRLDLVKSIIDRLPSTGATLDRLSDYIDKFANDKLGISADTTADRAIQHILKNDIEVYFNKQGTSAARMADLTRGLTDRSATKQQATETWNTLKSITDSDRHRLMDQESKANLPSSGQQQSNQQQSNNQQNTPLRQAITANEGSKANQVSYMGAVGEHQIMPKTAAPYLAKLGYRPNQLAEPAVNTAVFHAIMDDIEKKYPDRPDLAMAEYHGGPGAVLPNGTVDPRWKEPDTATRKGKYTTEYVKEGMDKLRQLQGGQQVSPPTATSTPQQDAAYRAQQGNLPPQQPTQGTGTQPIGKPVKLNWGARQ